MLISPLSKNEVLKDCVDADIRHGLIRRQRHPTLIGSMP